MYIFPYILCGAGYTYPDGDDERRPGQGLLQHRHRGDVALHRYRQIDRLYRKIDRWTYR